MKKHIFLLLFFYFSFFTLSAQSWLWVETANNDSTINSYTDALSVATDSSGNIFEAGVFAGASSFGTANITTSAILNGYIVKYNPAGTALWGSAPGIGTNDICIFWDVAADRSGNSYTTGYFTGNVTFGTYNLSGVINFLYNGGNTFITKYDPSGNVLWALQSTQPSSNTYSASETMTLDSAGNIYVAGYFYDTLQLSTTTLITSNTSNLGIFIAKYTTAGSFVWAKMGEMTNTYFSIESVEPTLAIDANNNLYLSGGFVNNLTYGSVTLNTGKSGDFYLLRLDTAGNIKWGRAGMVKGNSNVPYYSYSKIPNTVDLAGNIYVAGSYIDTLQIGPYQLAGHNNTTSIFLAKYDSAGNVLWARKSSDYTTSPEGVLAYSLSTSKWNNIYFSGNFIDTIDFNGLTVKGTGAYPSFLIELDTSGKAVCGTSIDNSNDDNNAVVADPLGANAYFTGDAENHSCSFGTDTLHGTIEWSFLGKWKSCCPIIAAKMKSTNAPCYNQAGSATITISGDTNLTYVWSPSGGTNATATGLSAGSYTVIATDVSGCSITAGVIITQPALPVLSGTDSICAGKTAVMSVSGATTYTWSTGATTSSVSVSPATTQIYTVIATYGSGCTDSLFSTVYVTPYPGAAIANVAPLCEGNTTTLSASGGSTYLWSTGATTSDIIVSPTVTTSYSVSVSTNGCADTANTTVKVILASAASACCSTQINAGQSTNLLATGGGTYLWLPSNGLSCDTCPNPTASPSQTTTYTVTITSDSGCITTDTIIIDVTCSDVFVPDAFSPNGDGQNDILYVKGSCIKSMDFIIYDRWGNKVFESENINNGWDGRFKDQPMNAGTYVYYIKALMYNGALTEKKGSISLVR